MISNKGNKHMLPIQWTTTKKDTTIFWINKQWKYMYRYIYIYIYDIRKHTRDLLCTVFSHGSGSHLGTPNGMLCSPFRLRWCLTPTQISTVWCVPRATTIGHLGLTTEGDWLNFDEVGLAQPQPPPKSQHFLAILGTVENPHGHMATLSGMQKKWW